MNGRAIDLLTVLDACVKRDDAYPGFSGMIAVSVRSPSGERWWRADFSGGTRTEFAHTRPKAPDVVLELSEDAAESLLTSGTLPEDAGAFVLSGDLPLFRRFIARYFQKTTALDVRLKRGRV